MTYYVLAYYHFTPIENPQEEVKNHKKFFEGRDYTSRIYISKEGINGQMSAALEDAEAYMQWMKNREGFTDIYFKIHEHFEQAFPHQTIKTRDQLVAFDFDVDLKNKGKHLSPKEWSEMLDKSKEHVLLDIRNDYEWDVGHFEGSERPTCKTSREFKAYTEKLLERIDKKKTPVMMCCTGGIRCEYYSAYLKEKGVETVYQLDGGIINYGLEEGSKHWKGKLFVFDDRLAIPISDDEAEVVGKCHSCRAEAEQFYNCANMECNDLFLCCPDCLKENAGCCSKECSCAPHVRPYSHQATHKPFRRKHYYTSCEA